MSKRVNVKNLYLFTVEVVKFVTLHDCAREMSSIINSVLACSHKIVCRARV